MYPRLATDFVAHYFRIRLVQQARRIMRDDNSMFDAEWKKVEDKQGEDLAALDQIVARANLMAISSSNGGDVQQMNLKRVMPQITDPRT